MKRFIVVFLLLLSSSVLAQVDTLRITTYNILNFPGSTGQDRIQYFRTVLDEIEPDILVVQEILSQEGVDLLLCNVLNYEQPDLFTAAPFVDGYDTDNALFYRTENISFVSNSQIDTELRDISEYVLRYSNIVEQQEFRVYSCHLKASTGSTNEQKRLAEASILRDELNKLSANCNFFVCGDFNVYKGSENAFQMLISSQNDNDGRCFDPINQVGNWHNSSSYAGVHTQSTRTTQFGGGASGGLDDRFDFILISNEITETGTFQYLNNSYTAFGNDGLHFNLNINDNTNLSVSASVADALYYASDHLPVYLDFTVSGTVVPVELTCLSYELITGNSVKLTWETATESNNYGFYVERDGKEIGFVEGHGTTTLAQHYTFTDKPEKGTYEYRLKQVDFDGSFEYSIAIHVTMANSFSLAQNYPNPFNGSTVIKYTLQKKSPVRLQVFDMMGRLVKDLVNDFQGTGIHFVSVSTDDLKSGVYFYRLRAGDFESTKKMMLVK